MGLLNYYNDTNKVILQGKAVAYSSEIEHGSWSWTPQVNVVQTYNHDFRITRTCTYQYKYVGMDLSTANNCKAYFDDKFNRTYYTSVWNSALGTFTTTQGGQTLMADVKVQHVGGNMYECAVNVNEVDTRMKIEDPSSLASLFAYENSREYDFQGISR